MSTYTPKELDELSDSHFVQYIDRLDMHCRPELILEALQHKTVTTKTAIRRIGGICAKHIELIDVYCDLYPAQPFEQYLHFCGSVECAQKLVQHGADPTASFIDEFLIRSTPLGALIRVRADVELIDYVIAQGADVNSVGAHGESAILCQIWYANFSSKVTRLLIDNGVRMGVSAPRDTTPLIEYCVVIRHRDEQNLEMLDLLISNTPKEALTHYSKHHESDVCIALMHTRSTFRMLKHFIETTERDLDLLIDGKTLLMHALQHCNYELVELLIECGASVHTTDADGLNVLDYAVLQRLDMLYPIALLCVEHGALLNAASATKRVVLAFKENYATHYFEALHRKLCGELVSLLLHGDVPDALKHKADIEGESDLPLLRVFDLPYHRIPNGLDAFVTHCKNNLGYGVDLQIPTKILDVLKVLAKEVHNTKFTRQKAEAFALQHEDRTKRLKSGN